MERYHFFASSCHQFGFNCKSLSELKSDESDRDGALASVLKVLRKIHHMFFDVWPLFLNFLLYSPVFVSDSDTMRTFLQELVDNLDDRDVRQVKRTIEQSAFFLSSVYHCYPVLSPQFEDEHVHVCSCMNTYTGMLSSK